MIFLGDVALPDSGVIDYSESLEVFGSKSVFFNLEGSLVKNESPGKRGVYNNLGAIKELTSKVNLAGVAIGNNHISDITEIYQSCQLLKESNIGFTGAGPEETIASRPLRAVVQKVNVSVLNFGWEAISCQPAKEGREGVNELTPKGVIDQFKKEKELYPENKVIVYFHWNYELELYPQPYEIQLARLLIDLGANAVLGCHSHRVQPIEIYKGRPIVYGLGNWLFAQNYFWNGTLRFPDFCSKQLAFELDIAGTNHKCHWYSYIKNEGKLRFEYSEDLLSSRVLNDFVSISRMNSKEYRTWFKDNRKKSFLLPIFTGMESNQFRLLKINWIMFRHYLIQLLILLRIK